MKIVQSFNNASHGGLVFFSANDAKTRNLSNWEEIVQKFKKKSGIWPKVLIKQL